MTQIWLNAEGETATSRVVIPPSVAGERLDKALIQLQPAACTDGEADPGAAPAAVNGKKALLSRTAIQRLIQSSLVRCNGVVIVAPDYKVRVGDHLEWSLPELQSPQAEPEDLPLTIVYEDHALIVLDKSAGMTVHPAPGHASGTLVNALLHHCDTLSDGSWTGIGGVLRPGIVHRLDKDTSGLLVAAKNDHAHQHLAAQFKAHTASREYWAVVKGRPSPDRSTILTGMGRHPHHRQKMAVVDLARGREAITHYRVVESLGLFSLIACRLETGRTHQIRVHLAHIGHPLLGDPVYSRPWSPPSDWPSAARQVVIAFRRQALHAAELSFDHPDDNRRVCFQAPIPGDLAALLAVLRTMTEVSGDGR